jgi:hypothetical protein
MSTPEEQPGTPGIPDAIDHKTLAELLGKSAKRPAGAFLSIGANVPDLPRALPGKGGVLDFGLFLEQVIAKRGGTTLLEAIHGASFFLFAATDALEEAINTIPDNLKPAPREVISQLSMLRAASELVDSCSTMPTQAMILSAIRSMGIRPSPGMTLPREIFASDAMLDFLGIEHSDYEAFLQGAIREAREREEDS